MRATSGERRTTNFVTSAVEINLEALPGRNSV